MLNRIRRAISPTSRRRSPMGRHRRSLIPTGPARACARPAPTVGATHILRQRQDGTYRTDSPTGVDIALVRPYVLAREEHRRLRRSVIVAPHLPPAAWSLLAGGQ